MSRQSLRTQFRYPRFRCRPASGSERSSLDVTESAERSHTGRTHLDRTSTTAPSLHERLQQGIQAFVELRFLGENHSSVPRGPPELAVAKLSDANGRGRFASQSKVFSSFSFNSLELLDERMCPEVRGKRTAPSTPSPEYHIRRQPPRVREPRSDVGSRRCVVVESGQRR